MQHIATESRTFVLCVRQSASMSDYPPKHFAESNGTHEDADEIVIAGGCCIASPRSCWLVRSGKKEDVLVVGVLTRTRLPRVDLTSIHVGMTADQTSSISQGRLR